MAVAPVLALPAALDQDERWIRGEPLVDMDRHHRANLIPFLRRNVVVLYAVAHDVTQDEFTPAEAEEWLEQTPLMRRLVELEAGRPLEERRETFERNQTHQAETGYQKIQLVDPREIERRRREFEDAFGDDGWWEP